MRVAVAISQSLREPQLITMRETKDTRLVTWTTENGIELRG
jgi:hypothetical protein